MKKINIFTLLFFASFVLFSCSSDDDSNDDVNDNGVNTSESYFMYGDTEYTLEGGIISEFGMWEEAYNFDIALYTTTINVVNGEYIPGDDIFSGVTFEMFTDNPDDLAEGTYTLSMNSYTPGDIPSAEAMIDFDYEEFTNGGENEGAWREINEGTVQIIQNGPNYEITFDCITINDVVVSGHFEGTLQHEDYSNEPDGSTDRTAAPKKSLLSKMKK